MSAVRGAQLASKTALLTGWSLFTSVCSCKLSATINYHLPVSLCLVMTTDSKLHFFFVSLSFIVNWQLVSMYNCLAGAKLPEWLPLSSLEKFSQKSFPILCRDLHPLLLRGGCRPWRARPVIITKVQKMPNQLNFSPL